MSTTPTPVRLANREGFTLIEVVVAAVILTAALMTMAGFTVRYQQTDTRARILARAQQLAGERLELVRTATPYQSIDTMATTESSLPNATNYTRVTQVRRVGGATSDTVDYRIVTVRVTAPNNAVVSRTTIVGAF